MLYLQVRSTTSLIILFLIIGLLLRNPIFLSMAFALVLFYASALAIEQPRKISVKRDPKTMVTSSFVGQIIERSVLVSIEDGIGPVIVHDAIPEQFELVEGENYEAFWKWLHPINAKMTYKIRCTKRGSYKLFTPSYESRHPVNIRSVIKKEKQPEGTLTVRPKLLNVRRLRDTRTVSNIPLPIGSVAKGGIPTTDFRELREYSQGDPYDSINWKATARFSSRGSKLPFVNVFEKEGRKIVWLILDISGPMSIGTNVRDVLDHAVEATNALSYFYVERGCSVGLYICKKQAVIIPPDTGRRQYQLILRELINIQTTASQPLANAAERCGKYSFGANPLFVVLTCLTPSSGPSIIRGIKEARKYTSSSRRRRSIIVVDTMPYGLISTMPEEEWAAETLRIMTSDKAHAIIRVGALLVRWNPAKYDFARIMLRGMRA